jgi:hypothetical protein
MLDLIKAKVVRIELQLCVGEEVGPREGIRARWQWGPRQSGKPFKLSIVLDTIHR